MPEIARPEIPKLYQPVVERAKTSRAAALKAMCLQCVGYERKYVTACASTDCPLWTLRPYQERPKE
jgi:hypothetical protein